MTPADLQGLLAQARELQTRLAAVRESLAKRTVEGSAGGGLVTAVATGDLRIERVVIDPELLAGDDPALLQDLVAAAVNAALANAQRMAQEEFQKITGLPAGLAGLGGPG